MAARPEPLAKIDRYFAAARIAHEAIWDLHHELVTREGADEWTRELLREAARIATPTCPTCRRRCAGWMLYGSEQELLDPAAAADTLTRSLRSRPRGAAARPAARVWVIARELTPRQAMDG